MGALCCCCLRRTDVKATCLFPGSGIPSTLHFYPFKSTDELDAGEIDIILTDGTAVHPRSEGFSCGGTLPSEVGNLMAFVRNGSGARVERDNWVFYAAPVYLGTTNIGGLFGKRCKSDEYPLLNHATRKTQIKWSKWHTATDCRSSHDELLKD